MIERALTGGIGRIGWFSEPTTRCGRVEATLLPPDPRFDFGGANEGPVMLSRCIWSLVDEDFESEGGGAGASSSPIVWLPPPAGIAGMFIEGPATPG